MSVLNKESAKTRTIIDTIKHYYLSDERPFAVGYSGGKDSSVTVDLVMKALLEIDNPQKTVFIQFSDTLLEMDNTIIEIHKSLKRLNAFVEKHNLPIVIKKVRPVVSESFFSLLIGKGYRLPTSNNRWCTDRMKNRPQARLIDEYQEEFPNGMIAVVGMRAEEGEDRAKRLDRLSINGMYKEHSLAKWNLLAPIENMTQDEVWAYLFTSSLEWIDEISLGKIYADASDDGDECKTMLESGTDDYKAGCSSSSRYGCWICSIIHSKDKTLHNLTKKYHYMLKMEEYRNWLIDEGQGWKNRRIYRNDNQGRKYFNRGGYREGMSVPSGYTLEFRKEMLERLWKLNKEVREFRLDDLISHEELCFIQNEWLKEGDIELTVEKITGIKLEIDDRLFGLIVVISKLFERETKTEYNLEASYYDIPFVSLKTSTRFYANMISELIKNGENNESIIRFFDDLYITDYFNKKRAAAFSKFMKSKTYNKKFFPTELQEEVIKQEWEKDELNFNSFIKNEVYKKVVRPDEIEFGLGSDYKKRYKKALKEYKPYENLMDQLDELEEKGDIIECESISLTDKMAFFEEW